MVGTVSMITRFGSAATVLMVINKKRELCPQEIARDREWGNHSISIWSHVVALDCDEQTKQGHRNESSNQHHQVRVRLGNMRPYTFSGLEPSRKLFDILRPSSNRKPAAEKSLFCDTKPKPKGDTWNIQRKSGLCCLSSAWWRGSRLRPRTKANQTQPCG